MRRLFWYPAYATGVFSSRKPESATHGDGLGDLKEMQIFIALACRRPGLRAAPWPSFGQTAPKM